MKEFYVDFTGWTVITAENEEEVADIFWKNISDNISMPVNVEEVDNIEEKED